MVVERASISNYFECFGLEVDFDIDIDLLDNKYLELQSKQHPDCFYGVNKELKNFVHSGSVLINEAYRTLKSPLKRAEYLLSLMFKKYDSIKPTQDILVEAMEMREKAKNSDPFLSMTYDECIENIRNAFSKGDLVGMSYQTMRLKYITRIKEDICN